MLEAHLYLFIYLNRIESYILLVKLNKLIKLRHSQHYLGINNNNKNALFS